MASELIRRLIDIIVETERRSLYHGTSLSGLIGILHYDHLMDDGWEDGHPGASFTTSPAVAERFAKRAAMIRAGHAHPNFPLDNAEAAIDPMHGTGGAVIIFDRAILERNHRLENYLSSTAANTEPEDEVRSMIDQEGEQTPPVRDAVMGIRIMGGKVVLDAYVEALGPEAQATYAREIAFIRQHLS